MKRLYNQLGLDNPILLELNHQPPNHNFLYFIPLYYSYTRERLLCQPAMKIFPVCVLGSTKCSTWQQK
jgi:hypothetical protein